MPSDVVIFTYKTETKKETKRRSWDKYPQPALFVSDFLFLIVLVVFDVFAERQLEHG